LLTEDDDINMSDEEFIEKKISAAEKQYLELLKYMTDMIYISSTDSNNSIPLISHPLLYNVGPDDGKPSIPLYLEEVVKEEEELDFEAMVEKWKEANEEEVEYIENENKKRLYEDIEVFLSRSKFIRPNLSEYLFGELCNWVLFSIEHMRPIKLNADDFFIAALNNGHDMLNRLPGVLNRGWMGNMTFGFRYGANVRFEDRKKCHDYILTERIFDNLKFNFPMLSQPENNDYQLRIIAGYVIANIGILKNEDIYLNESKGSKDWRNYLAEKVKSYCIRYNELYKNA